MVVDINEIERCLRYFKSIKSASIEDICWMRGSEPLNPSPEELRAFAFIGLSNLDFPSVVGWLHEDIGISAAIMQSHKVNNESNNKTADV